MPILIFGPSSGLRFQENQQRHSQPSCLPPFIGEKRGQEKLAQGKERKKDSRITRLCHGDFAVIDKKKRIPLRDEKKTTLAGINLLGKTAITFAASGHG
jgi:hypothetical protein